MKIGKKTICVVGLLLCAAGFYSCNSNDNLNIIREKTEMQVLSDNIGQIIGYNISEKECYIYWDFYESCMELAEITRQYMNSLTPKEQEYLINNINDDDYVAKIVKEINVESEIINIGKNKNVLLNNTRFSNYDYETKVQMFSLFSDSSEYLLVKSRSEGGVDKSECERRLNEDYAYASGIYIAAMAACSCATVGLGTCACAVAASLTYNYAITLADRAYRDCIANAN